MSEIIVLVSVRMRTVGRDGVALLRSINPPSITSLNDHKECQQLDTIPTSIAATGLLVCISIESLSPLAYCCGSVVLRRVVVPTIEEAEHRIIAGVVLSIASSTFTHIQGPDLSIGFIETQQVFHFATFVLSLVPDAWDENTKTETDMHQCDHHFGNGPLNVMNWLPFLMTTAMSAANVSLGVFCLYHADGEEEKKFAFCQIGIQVATIIAPYFIFWAVALQRKKCRCTFDRYGDTFEVIFGVGAANCSKIVLENQWSALVAEIGLNLLFAIKTPPSAGITLRAGGPFLLAYSYVP